MNLLRETLAALDSGGFVMVPLILVSFVMWALILNLAGRLRHLDNADISQEEFVACACAGRLPTSTEGLKGAVLQEFIPERSGRASLDSHILDRAALRVRPRLTRGLATIAILAAVAPLLGLLGTVDGMMATFNVISSFGTGNARAMAGGISMALITTQTGLVVAIPGLYMSVSLLRRARRLEDGLDEAVLGLKRQLGSQA